MNYQESLAWIHSKLKFGIKPGLKRMDWMLEQLGRPQNKIKGIHIVGTNGKGSTVANLLSIFKEAGYKVGTFTSPYIMDFRERIAVDGQMISEQELIDLTARVYDVVEALPAETGLEPATEFEIITVMMFLYFADINPVDLVLVEAGLGGRQDSTNVFSPLALVCPSIGLDHQAILGDSYEAIAREKAGAIKPDCPFIFAADREDVGQVFLEICQKQSAPAYQLGRDFSLEQGSYKEAGQLIMDKIEPGLPGDHQQANAALAIKLSLLLQETYPKLSHENIKRGLAKTRWMGRTELLRPNLMLDGAHNQESISALIALLNRDYSHKKIRVLFAAIEGKPVDSMLADLSQIGQVTVTSFDYPKALNLWDYPPSYNRVSDFSDWLKRLETASQEDFFLVTGSLYFIAQVRQTLLKSSEK